MRLPRVRFTLRRMMVGVAVLALALGGIVWAVKMRDRSAAYHRRAEAYSELQTDYFSGGSELWKIYMRRDAWAEEMERKYRHAARFPWLPVEPDKPPPTDAVRTGLGVDPEFHLMK